MAYNKNADDNYRKKCKTIGLKYTPNEMNDYLNIIHYCKKNNLTYQNYIKNLIRADLGAKGFNVNSAATMDIDSVDTP